DPRWADVVAALDLDAPPAALWEPGPAGGRWLPGARLNLSVQCLDRQLPERASTVALHWEGEPGDRRSLSYGELHQQVRALARALRAMGVGEGDRVGLHLGWLPETVVTMLACARVGAVHSLLPVPLPVEPLADRLSQLDLKVLFTQDGAWRHGAVLPLKARADEALLAAGSVEHTIVVRRTGMDVAWFEGDRWWHDVVTSAPADEPAGHDSPVSVPADHPVVIVPLANRGGEPVFTVHGTGTVLTAASAVHAHLRTGGPFWCAGDIAWAVTQFHGIYGPLACGDTTVMYEGTLDVPNHRRVWDIIDRYGVESLLTSPSVVRTVRGWAREMPAPNAAPSLRRLVTAGEPVEPELAEWLVDAFAGRRIELGDAWGQLELGGIVRVTGLSGTPMPDCGLDLVDHDGRPAPDGEPGEAVLRRPWPGTVVGVEGSQAAVAETHWTRHPGCYSTGDMAVRRTGGGPGGDLVFLGRTDDVVSISGQLVSLREVQEVLTDHPYVRQAEVTWRKDPELGRSIVAAVALEQGAPTGDLDGVAVELMDNVRELMGGLARPRAVLVVDRFGDELSRDQRARAFATLATPDRRGGPRQVSWAQVLAAAGHPVV
ncbi:acyl-CoA synthetase, partial [Ornithinicoccus halotolerans]|uniref:acyl-CoA synthetase n=1 Tax=Ornithinicoccus halotolerans TaxID=1748220 RepID=UPI001296928E